MPVKAVDKWAATDVFDIGDARYEESNGFDPSAHDMTYDEERSGVAWFNAPTFSFEVQEGYEMAKDNRRRIPVIATKYMVLPVKKV